MRVLPAPPVRRVPSAVRVALCWVPGTVACGLLLACAAGIDPAAPQVTGGDGGASTPTVIAGRRSLMPAAAVPARRASTAYRAPRPRIVPREAWLPPKAPEPPPARYADRVDAVFVHHTDSPNRYACTDAPRIIRALYAGQAGSRKWDDIGYNFLVDRCGTVYEGRAGGAERPVVGAHTQGFNRRSTGVAAIGTFTAGTPVPKAMTDAIAGLAAWKLGLSGIDPRGAALLVSTNNLSRFPTGTDALLRAVAGHKDGYATHCPGAALTAELPAIRETAARLQGRQDASP
ncbi:N-acetylmuramoyl-L-alanine amidase [Streptomyces sp. WAC 01529]|uniref:peptidoglycan recognition protein family protein n=1 Tax=Streptomyces sp. WAC 01529 TaxID=2203205 RepID=UPI000F6EF201|nr:peptidoglycan recognition protein [Streptomyces sp. WAC 01529]AZM51358.1 N-acetylmuramoyl-L-alanine amidase [Streptomyces sp. WAC 01529]